MDKVSFISKLNLLSRATTDDENPMPGYMFQEICKISFESGSHCQDLLAWLNDRLRKKSCYVKLKVLRILKFLVNNGHRDFKDGLRKQSKEIMEAIKFSGPPDPLHGNALYLQVRQEAKELSEILFHISDETEGPFLSNTVNTGIGMGSQGCGKMVGFGNAPVVEKSFSSALIDGIRDVAEKIVDGTRNEVGFVKSSDEFSSGYLPSKLLTDKSICEEISSQEVEKIHDSRKIASSKSELHSTLPMAFLNRHNHDHASYIKPEMFHFAELSPNLNIQGHIKGVAGGGWEDDDDDDTALTLPCNKTNLHQDSHSIPTTSISENLVSNEMFISEDYSAEKHLVEDIISSSSYPTHKSLKIFIACCANVNCEKVVDFLNCHLCFDSIVLALNSMLSIEALLRTDLVHPNYIASVCYPHLRVLFETNASDDRVKQKARKIIRILEKLAPEQNSCLDRGYVNTNMVDREFQSNTSRAWTCVQEENEVDDIVSLSVFSFLRTPISSSSIVT